MLSRYCLRACGRGGKRGSANEWLCMQDHHWCKMLFCYLFVYVRHTIPRDASIRSRRVEELAIGKQEEKTSVHRFRMCNVSYFMQVNLHQSSLADESERKVWESVRCSRCCAQVEQQSFRTFICYTLPFSSLL